MSERVPEEQLWSWVDRSAPELDAYLAEHPEAREEVDEMRRAMGAAGSASITTPLPESIGDYRIEELLGAGAMGVVYEAEQPNPRRRVALKVIRGSWVHDERRRRLFQREAQALARLKHPAIATIFEAGETDRGEPFFAMELIRGEPLVDWALKGDVARRRRLEVLRDVALGVHHAHEHGVIHRDLKPTNILVDGDGRPKILDFGLAHVADPEASLSLTAAEPGNVLGTLRYMSPEQAKGLAAHVTGATDVYSLGVLLFELLTGHAPYDLDKASFLEAVRIVYERDPTPPRELDVTIERSLEAVVLKALAKEPRLRYQSASELAQDLDRYLAGDPVTARPPGFTYHAVRWVGRNRIAAVVVAFSFLLMFSMGGIRGAGDPLEDRITGSGYPTLAPWTAVRWKGTVPLVEVGERWYELEKFERLSQEFVVGLCKETAQGWWRKRFEEDIVEVAARVLPLEELTDGVDLHLVDLETGEGTRMEDVPMTSDNRREVKRSRSYHLSRAPFESVEPVGDEWFVTVAGRRYAWLSIEGFDLARFVQHAKRTHPSSWEACVSEEAVLLLEELGKPVLDSVEVTLKRPEADTTETIELPLTKKKRDAARTARLARRTRRL